MKLFIKKTNGETLEFNTFMGFFSESINAKKLLQAFQDKNIPSDDISELKIKSDSIMVEWGSQFDNFHNLKRIELFADDKIEINCYSTKDSEIQVLALKAREIWFNDGAFADSEKLTGVYIYGKILNGHHNGLSEFLFQNCTNLRTVSGSYHGEKMMPCIFENCTSLELPLNFQVKNLGWHTFRNCSSLKTIHLHNGLEDLGYEAFQNCTSLEDIYIPDSVNYLGTGTFDGCSRLFKIHLPQNIKCIPERFLANCVSIKKVFLSDGLERIDKEAFKNCTALQNPWIPNGLTSIGDRAFYGCSSIQKIYLPESISTIGKDAFANISGLNIHGKKGTLAEKYAIDNGFSFIEEY